MADEDTPSGPPAQSLLRGAGVNGENQHGVGFAPTGTQSAIVRVSLDTGISANLDALALSAFRATLTLPTSAITAPGLF